MKNRDFEFYQDLYPWLDESWEYTGAEAYGLVWWWKPLGSLRSNDISATVKIGFVQAPNHGHLFVRVSTEDYPQVHDSAKLESSAETGSASLLEEANRVALEVFERLIVTAKEKQREFEEELNRSR